MLNLNPNSNTNNYTSSWGIKYENPNSDAGFTITKEIGFDYGHRVPDHASKCRNPHGHRGKVVAHCQATSLIKEGSQSGMVLDFSFLKEILTTQIHDLFDHRFLIYKEDELLKIAFGINKDTTVLLLTKHIASIPNLDPINIYKTMEEFLIVELPVIPTAENLAFLSFHLLKEEVKIRSNNNANLTQIDFWETPTSMASFSL